MYFSSDMRQFLYAWVWIYLRADMPESNMLDPVHTRKDALWIGELPNMRYIVVLTHITPHMYEIEVVNPVIDCITYNASSFYNLFLIQFYNTWFIHKSVLHFSSLSIIPQIPDRLVRHIFVNYGNTKWRMGVVWLW